MSIEVRHITKTFGKFRALEDVSLEVKSGELLALLGPSGCGKTTLLRIIAGLEECDDLPEALLLFDGHDVRREAAGARKVGFVFQHYAMFKHMSALENVAFGMRVKPRNVRPSHGEIKKRAMALLKLVQLEAQAHHLPAELSGGQRQRIALARALAVEPRVLLLDEPFGALDARVRQDLRRWLRKLHDEIHVTSVLVTHDQEEALEVADRVVVMNEGRIEQIGTPDEVFHHPANEFVMNFLGEVNFFHGRVEDGKPMVGPEGSDDKARLLVRPFDVEVSRQAGHESVQATVVRVQSAGSSVKVELHGVQGQLFRAEMTHDRFHELGLKRGDEVFISPRGAKVFSG